MRSKSLQASAVWRLIEVAGGELTSFLVFTILARVLVPEHFGAVALATTVIMLLQVFVYSGAVDSLTQLPTLEERHFRSATAANLTVGAMLVALGSLAAWPLGLLLDREEFTVILLAMLPMLLARAFMAPMFAVIRRDMDFKSIAFRTLVATTVGGVVAVTLASQGAGVWALVAQQWTAELIGALMLVKRSPYKPWHLGWDRRSLQELSVVAIPVTWAALALAATRRLDTFAIGLRMGDAIVGLYFMVSRLVFAMQMLTQYGLGEVAMVVMCKLRPRIEKPWIEISAVLRLAAWPTFMLFGLTSLVGPRIVPLVFGPAWVPAAEPMALHAALSPAGAVVGLAGLALVSAGSAKLFKRLSIAVACIQLAATFIAAAWGLTAVVVAIGTTQALSVPFALAYLRRAEQISWGQVLGRICPVIGAYAACFAPCEAIRFLYPESVWVVGTLFLAAGTLVGYFMLRHDWRLVTGALARVRAAEAAEATAPPSGPDHAPGTRKAR
jgi:PST family polysaccharide transporter